MIVILDDEVFSSASSRLDLLGLFQIALTGCHRVQTTPPFEPAGERAVNRWIEGLDDQTRDEVQLVLEIGLEEDALGLPAEVTVQVRDIRTADWRANVPFLPVADAIRMLRRPLQLIVENRRNDGAFLRAVAPSPWRRALRQAIEKRWVDIEHGGGSDMKARLEEVNSREEALRLWALLDSDAREPGRPSERSEQLCQICLQRGISHHRLARRAIENYLPAKALQAWAHIRSGSSRATRRRKADAFAGMQSEQRHHYNMKGGFSADRSQDIPSLFDSVEAHPDLQNGFGRDIASLYHQEDFPICEEWLARDGQQEETRQMIQLILQRM